MKGLKETHISVMNWRKGYLVLLFAENVASLTRSSGLYRNCVSKKLSPGALALRKVRKDLSE